jgi:hypothetical protein
LIGVLVEDSSPRRFFNFMFLSRGPVGGSRKAGDGYWGGGLLVELGRAGILVGFVFVLSAECF